MAKGSQGELNALRKRVAAYVKALIGLGIAAQTLSSSGGNYLAISRLISSGISIAGQLQRGIIVRVVGAPLVRRRPRSRRSASASEEFPELTTPSPFGPEARDQEAIEWEEVIPPSLSSAEIDLQPFSLARALPSIVAGQQSTFRALSSVNAAVARVVAGTAFGSTSPRSPPSQTSLEDGQRTSPDSFPEGQATTFAGEVPALAVSAAFMGAASSMAFNLSSAAHETTNIALGSQAVGAGFASQQSRTPNEGTAFAPSSQPATSPSLLQQSITGVVDTSLKSPPSAGANLGLTSSASSSPSSSSAAAASASSDLAVTRETSAPAGLSAEVGGPSSGAPSSATSPSSPTSGSGVDLNAGPYTVPNGFNSVLSTPAVAAASQLSMQVRSLGASGPSGQLPMRASQEASTVEGQSLGMALVPDQYPSSYPAGAAYSLSGIVASLGLGQFVPSSAASAEGGQELGAEEAPGLQDATVTALGPQAGESLGASGPGLPDTSLPYAEAEPGYQPRDELSSSPRLLGERWIGSLAAAAGIGGALMGLLMLASASPSSGSWTPGAAVAGGRSASIEAGSYARAASASIAEAEGGPVSAREVSGTDSFPPIRTPSSNQASAPAATQRGTVWGELRQPGTTILASEGLALAASAREEAAFEASKVRAATSVWEVATTLPGVLTPSLGAQSSGEADRPSAGPFLIRPAGSADASSEQSLAGQPPSRAAFDALQLAASLRAAMLSASATTMGARAAGLSSSAAGAAAPRESTAELGYLTSGSQGTFVNQGASGFARRVDLFGLSRGAPGQPGFQETPQAASFAATRLAALQAAFASRSLFAAGAAWPGSSSSSFKVEAPTPARPTSATRALARRSERPMDLSSPPASVSRDVLPTGALTQSAESTSAFLDGSGASANGRELEAALSSLSREGRTGAEGGVFFGLAAVSQALSLAAMLPSAAQLNGPLASLPRATGIRPSGARSTRQLANAPAEAQLAVEASPRMTEGWRSAPEEALARMLEEQPGKAPSPSQEAPQEADDREARRKIEKMIEEDLRRHGYQT